MNTPLLGNLYFENYTWFEPLWYVGFLFMDNQKFAQDIMNTFPLAFYESLNKIIQHSSIFASCYLCSSQKQLQINIYYSVISAISEFVLLKIYPSNNTYTLKNWKITYIKPTWWVHLIKRGRKKLWAHLSSRKVRVVHGQIFHSLYW